MKYKKVAEAWGKRTSKGFMIFKGSKINPTLARNCPDSVKRERESRTRAGVINESFELSEDILFKSPSAAACFVAGAVQNGFEAWRDSTGRKLKAIKDAFSSNGSTPADEPSSNSNDSVPPFSMLYNTKLHTKYGKGEAWGQFTKDGFIVFKGSKINPTFAPSCRNFVKEQRKSNASIINENYELTEDILFKSSSGAAAFIAGANFNGSYAWRDSTGRKLKEIENASTTNSNDTVLTSCIEKKTKFHMKYGKGEAWGEFTCDGFMIFKGSKINPSFSPSCPDSVKRDRDYKASLINSAYEVIEDILFQSSSGAAAFIAGASKNGYDVWRDSAGHTLNELKASQSHN